MLTTTSDLVAEPVVLLREATCRETSKAKMMLSGYLNLVTTMRFLLHIILSLKLPQTQVHNHCSRYYSAHVQQLAFQEIINCWCLVCLFNDI